MTKKTTRRTNYTTKKTSRTRNIPKTEQPFLEGISCDIYVGKKAGISVRNAIQKAKKSITVISPFLSGNMITEDIFNSLNKDVQVNIISKDNEKIYPFLRKNLFKYHSMPGFGKFIILLGKLILTMFYLILSIAILEIFTLFFFDVSFTKSVFPITKNNLLALTIFLGLFTFFLRTVIKNNEFYYSLRDNFNIHILSKNYDLHSKIYIIDNKIAFLGSLNFTDTGFMLNHETCIKITDKTAIKHLNNVYKDLLKVNSISLKELKYKISKKK
ncbi:phospholipase D-like domain-containing protein [Leptotrichia trevisanii]|uniref:phospholipase D-like domain-containing protein n=1 Tax=Leptotrichia trevisanii TaxID=109328 RepID=UPI0026EF5653|nr:phospholipase D-like domain-containing protein [Leptotrichia trevisanii]